MRNSLIKLLLAGNQGIDRSEFTEDELKNFENLTEIKISKKKIVFSEEAFRKIFHVDEYPELGKLMKILLENYEEKTFYELNRFCKMYKIGRNRMNYFIYRLSRWNILERKVEDDFIYFSLRKEYIAAIFNEQVNIFPNDYNPHEPMILQIKNKMVEKTNTLDLQISFGINRKTAYRFLEEIVRTASDQYGSFNNGFFNIYFDKRVWGNLEENVQVVDNTHIFTAVNSALDRDSYYFINQDDLKNFHLNDYKAFFRIIKLNEQYKILKFMFRKRERNIITYAWIPDQSVEERLIANEEEVVREIDRTSTIPQVIEKIFIHASQNIVYDNGYCIDRTEREKIIKKYKIDLDYPDNRHLKKMTVEDYFSIVQCKEVNLHKRVNETGCTYMGQLSSVDKELYMTTQKYFRYIKNYESRDILATIPIPRGTREAMSDDFIRILDIREDTELTDEIFLNGIENMLNYMPSKYGEEEIAYFKMRLRSFKLEIKARYGQINFEKQRRKGGTDLGEHLFYSYIEIKKIIKEGGDLSTYKIRKENLCTILAFLRKKNIISYLDGKYTMTEGYWSSLNNKILIDQFNLDEYRGTEEETFLYYYMIQKGTTPIDRIAKDSKVLYSFEIEIIGQRNEIFGVAMIDGVKHLVLK